MNITLYDSVTEDQIPSDAKYIAAYVDGGYANYARVRLLFPSALVMSITITAAIDADCLDVELGDALPDSVVPWVARQHARGITRPVVYANAYTMKTSVIPLLESAGITQSQVRLWSAHYGTGEHICGPDTCTAVSLSVDGTQWTENAMGRNLDQSTLLPSFFGTTVNPPPVTNWTQQMINNLPLLKLGSVDTTSGVWHVRRLQAILNAVFGSSLVLDGNYGPGTEAEVKRVEKEFNLTEDGITGPKVWSLVLAGE
jgi:hypothetical protein